MKKLFNNPLFCRKVLASIALTLATAIPLTSLLIMPGMSSAQTSPGGQVGKDGRGAQGNQGNQGNQGGQTNPGGQGQGQGGNHLTSPQPIPRGDGGCDSTCSLGVPPPVSQACVSNQEARTIACSNPTPVGTINQRRSPVYCNGTIVSGGAWMDVSNNCVGLVCTPTNSTQTIACPVGYLGGVNQSKTDTTCNDGTSTTGTWTTTSNTCTLIPCPATSLNSNVGCGAGFNQGMITTSYSMSAAPACQQTSTVNNTCACNLPTINTSTDCPPGYSGKYVITKTRNATCNYNITDNKASMCLALFKPCPANTVIPSGCSSSNYTGNITTSTTYSAAPQCTQTISVNNACKCNLTTSTTQKDCPPGFTGRYTITNTPNLDCSGTTPSDNSTSVCVSSCNLQTNSIDVACPVGFTGRYTITNTPNATCSGYIPSNSGGNCKAEAPRTSLLLPGHSGPLVCASHFAKFPEIYMTEQPQCTDGSGVLNGTCTMWKVVLPALFGNIDCYHLIHFSDGPLCLPSYHMTTGQQGLICIPNVAGQPLVCQTGFHISEVAGFGMTQQPGSLFCIAN